jgi:hypothetical protein
VPYYAALLPGGYRATMVNNADLYATIGKGGLRATMAGSRIYSDIMRRI